MGPVGVDWGVLYTPPRGGGERRTGEGWRRGRRRRGRLGPNGETTRRPIGWSPAMNRERRAITWTAASLGEPAREQIGPGGVQACDTRGGGDDRACRLWGLGNRLWLCSSVWGLHQATQQRSSAFSFIIINGKWSGSTARGLIPMTKKKNSGV